MLQHLKIFVSGGSDKKTMTSTELLTRSTMLAVGIAMIMLALTVIIYFSVKGLATI